MRRAKSKEENKERRISEGHPVSHGVRSKERYIEIEKGKSPKAKSSRDLKKPGIKPDSLNMVDSEDY